MASLWQLQRLGGLCPHQLPLPWGPFHAVDGNSDALSLHTQNHGGERFLRSLCLGHALTLQPHGAFPTLPPPPLYPHRACVSCSLSPS